MEDKKHRPKSILFEFPEGLVGIQLIFRLKKGGQIVNFGTVKSVTTKDNEVRLRFDEKLPGLAKYVPGVGKKNQD